MKKTATFNRLTVAMATIVAMALSCLTAYGNRSEIGMVGQDAYADSLTVSLVTCYPGQEIFELYGHEAIRVRGEGRDSVWNFGVFNFREPNFVYRFVKGETDYLCAGYPFAWFLPEYQERGSKVVEQDLNLTQAEAHRLLEMLQWQALPENRRYRYNYVKDNCATRISEMVEKSVESGVRYPDSVRYGTFRNEMRHYNRNYPWYQFGIDIALGSGIDHKIDSRQEMFVPVEMERNMASASLSDGRPLVRTTRILNEGLEDATLPPTSFWLSPLFWSWIVFTLLTIVSVADLFRRHITRWVYSLWFFILGLAGCLVAFLVYVSSHEATSPNTLILWLNPLQLIMAVCVWGGMMRIGAIAMSYYNIVAMLCILIVWPFQNQSGNPAFFPLMGATLVLAVAYAIISHKQSYIFNGPLLKGGASRRGKSGSVKRKTASVTNTTRKARAK